MTSCAHTKGMIQSLAPKCENGGTDHLPVSYTGMKEIIGINGLSTNANPRATKEAHEHFMNNYHKMFVQPPKAKPTPPQNCELRKQERSTTSLKAIASKPKEDESPIKQPSSVAESVPQNLADHLNNLRQKKKVFTQDFSLKGRSRILRKMLRKLPFERTAEDNSLIFRALTHYSDLANQITPEELREVAVVTSLEVVDEPGITVFGNGTFHILLRGRVRPLSYPHMRILTDPDENWANVEVDERTEEAIIEEAEDDEEEVHQSKRHCYPPLSMGDCFGSLKRGEGVSSKVLTVVSLEPCEFLKLSSTNFNRIIAQMTERSHADKISLLQSNPAYTLWTRQPLINVASVIKWRKFPANTVLVSEGYKAPFLGYIQTGSCLVLRQVLAKKKTANGSTEIKTFQVVMGRLDANQSFGEVSLLDDAPMTSTVVTDTAVRLGVIDSNCLSDLDPDARKLLRLSSEPTFGHLTQEDIEAEYMHQESEKTWNEFKHSVVMDVINARGIRPGHGKWAK